MKFTQFHFSNFLEECSHFVSFTGLCRCLPVLGCVFLWVIVWIFIKCICYNSVSASICMFSLHQFHLDWNVIIAMKKKHIHALMCLSISRIKESVINVQGKLSMLSMTARIRNKRTMGRASVFVCSVLNCWKEGLPTLLLGASRCETCPAMFTPHTQYISWERVCFLRYVVGVDWCVS